MHGDDPSGGDLAQQLHALRSVHRHGVEEHPGATEAQMHAELERLWEELPFESRWFSANELERHRTMLSTFAQWHAQTRHEFTEVSLPGYTSSPEQYYGDCQVSR